MTLATPRDWWEMLDAEFGFTLDAAADHEHFMCTPYYTEEEDALKQPWEGIVWCTAPWHDDRLEPWLVKAIEESEKHNSTVVVLAPVQVYRSWWYELAMKAKEIRFIDGCLEFEKFDGTDDFIIEPHCLLIFAPHTGKTTVAGYPSRPPHKQGLADPNVRVIQTLPPRELCQ